MRPARATLSIIAVWLVGCAGTTGPSVVPTDAAPRDAETSRDAGVDAAADAEIIHGDASANDDARAADASPPDASPADANGGADAASPPSGLYEPDDGPEAGAGRIVVVRTVNELLEAIRVASPGDEITLANGTYELPGTVAVTRAGSRDQRIFVRAQSPLGATITVCADIGFRVDAPFWIFEGLVLRSRCTSESDHAFQVIGGGSDFILRRNHSQDFFAHVKLNASGGQWPDRFWAIDNEFRDTVPIPADGPFNVLNLDGGDAHVVRGNRFVDIAVDAARHASSIYLKATTRDALVEQNVVVCLKTLTSAGPTRGIFSGDQTGSGGICDGDCANVRNVYRNNFIINCQGGSGNRFGIGSTNERDTVYLHNLVHRVTQNFYTGDNPGPVLFKANLLYADFLITAGAGRPTLEDNTTVGAAGMSALYVAPDTADFSLRPSQALPKIPRDPRAPHDFCGHPRGEMTEIGPIDYSHPDAAACVARVRSTYTGL